MLLGNGDGTSQSALFSVLVVMVVDCGVAVGDFNRDGKADIAVINCILNNIGFYLVMEIAH